MSSSTVISNALCLHISDIEALIQGRIIAVLAQIFVHPGKKFALYPSYSKNVQLSDEQYYCSNFLPFSQNLFAKSQGLLLQPQQISLFPQNQQLQLPLLVNKSIKLKAWAKCELCKILDGSESLEVLSQLTIWRQEALEEIVRQHQYIFFTYLRVYHLSQPQYVIANQEKMGKFVSLPESLTVSEINPVLTDNTFAFRKHQLETLQPPQHPELEDLPAELEFLKATNPGAEKLQRDIQRFLGWNCEAIVKQSNLDLAWINDIAALGKRSQQEDEGKSNYQAGTDFENVVRKSLEFLGFTIDYSHKGGAGGLDLFCSKPYALVGECKAGKKIPNDTAVQLLNLGTLRLQSQELLKKATKLIIGPGEATPQLADAAKVHGMAIINPDTLEKLVKLQASYPNSVDLFRLKEYLKPGQSDEIVEKYIDQVESEIKLRSHIIKSVKELSESEKGHETVEIRVQYNAVFTKDQNSKLDDKSVHEILIELSSPLTGYLGRIKGEDWKRDRFYFLRDLPVH
jgi:hypothetical protein